MLSAPEASAQYASARFGPPPAAYVASYRPVYYNGMPHYWYGGHWFYRQGGAWRWYEHEPAGLVRARVGWAGNHYHWRR